MSPADPTVRAYTEVKAQTPRAITDLNAAIAKATTLSTALAKYNVTLTVPAPVKSPRGACRARSGPADKSTAGARRPGAPRRRKSVTRCPKQGGSNGDLFSMRR